MEFLYLLEKLRMPGLNELMLAITTLGEETAFLVIAMVMFWCVDKRRGYYVLSVGFLGTITSQFMKLWFRIPRPWVLDENFTILEQAREAASGYSFPSGHTQSAVGTLGAVGVTEKRPWLRYGCIALGVLVGFSRMYVGVHTPADVLVGGGLSVLFLWLLYKPVMRHAEKTLPWLMAFMALLALAFLWFVEVYPFPADVDVHNLESGTKNAYTLLGSLAGLAVVYVVDTKWLNFSVKACWWAQILKILGGLAAVLLVKEGLRSPLDAIFAGHLIARAVRYCFVVLMAGFVWPLTFRYFGALGAKKEKER